MNHRLLGLIGAALVTVFTASMAQGAGNIASKPTDLEIKVDTVNLKFSQTMFQLETGKYYRLTLSSDGNEEIDLKAPELWENSFISQLEINDVDVFVANSFHIGFDSEGEATIFFVPLRPGNYHLYADGFQDRGLDATFAVR